MSKTTNELNNEKQKQLQAELDELINVERPKNIKALKEARAEGDLSENADYDAAKNWQAEIEARINQILNILDKMKLENSQIYKTAESDEEQNTVKIGSVVTVTNLKTNVTYEVEISNYHSDPFQNIISNDSPVAQAVLGQKEKAVVTVKNIQKPYKLKIENIR